MRRTAVEMLFLWVLSSILLVGVEAVPPITELDYKEVYEGVHLRDRECFDDHPGAKCILLTPEFFDMFILKFVYVLNKTHWAEATSFVTSGKSRFIYKGTEQKKGMAEMENYRYPLTDLEKPAFLQIDGNVINLFTAGADGSIKKTFGMSIRKRLGPDTLVYKNYLFSKKLDGPIDLKEFVEGSGKPSQVTWNDVRAEDISPDLLNTIRTECITDNTKCTIDVKTGEVTKINYSAAARLGNFVLEHKPIKVLNTYEARYRFHHLDLPGYVFFFYNLPDSLDDWFSNGRPQFKKAFGEAAANEEYDTFKSWHPLLVSLTPWPQDADKLFQRLKVLIDSLTTTSPASAEDKTTEKPTPKPFTRPDSSDSDDSHHDSHDESHDDSSFDDDDNHDHSDSSESDGCDKAYMTGLGIFAMAFLVLWN
ncbi:unnamed protein product [Bursaphelenchus okinawaensis]|uniref:Uncharacterized protein n=1 Tax=Bursaphelenchus okinawaensis TaxID=465554 RepID=A0A811KCY9_9BILA|nr:unnamed protein product [Bursaphelenchus okinawaensis]CAG9099095.1 unnamed protein product [Bursaphelenchus okinawaensis]